MLTLIVVIVVVAVIAAAVVFGVLHRKPKAEKDQNMAKVLYSTPSDSPGYTRLLLQEPVGQRQASQMVVAEGPTTDPNGNPVRHEIHLHGQREVEVATGSSVTFPDGSKFDA